LLNIKIIWDVKEIHQSVVYQKQRNFKNAKKEKRKCKPKPTSVNLSRELEDMHWTYVEDVPNHIPKVIGLCGYSYIT
jgi:hypothetical protein